VFVIRGRPRIVLELGHSVGASARCIVGTDAMPWLADSDVDAAHRLVQGTLEAQTAREVHWRSLEALIVLVPADVLTWDHVELSSGVVRHDVVPVGAEPPGAFEAVVGRAVRHPLVAAQATGRRPALRLSEVVEPRLLSRAELYGDLLHPSGVEYEIAIGMHTGRGEAVVAALGRTEREFSERDRDLLDAIRPGLESALQTAEARDRLVRALATDPTPGTAVVLLDRYGEIELSSIDAERWLAEHFGPADHPGWLPAPVADWLALPPRPPLVSERDGRRLTVRLLPGDPHALLLEEDVAGFRADALDRLGLTARESEVLRAAAVMDDEAEIAWELFLSLHAVRERLERVEAKLGVHTPTAAVARALQESQ
jgi:DNA-binding CsgD family transcriptional regulator